MQKVSIQLVFRAFQDYTEGVIGIYGLGPGAGGGGGGGGGSGRDPRWVAYGRLRNARLAKPGSTMSRVVYSRLSAGLPVRAVGSLLKRLGLSPAAVAA